MIEWFMALPVQAQAAYWTWGAMVLALVIAFFKSERGVFLDLKRPFQSFVVVYALAVGLFLWSGGMLLTVPAAVALLAGGSSVG